MAENRKKQGHEQTSHAGAPVSGVNLSIPMPHEPGSFFEILSDAFFESGV